MVLVKGYTNASGERVESELILTLDSDAYRDSEYLDWVLS